MYVCVLLTKASDKSVEEEDKKIEDGKVGIERSGR